MLLSCLSLVLICEVSLTWGVNIIFLSLTLSPSHTIWDKTLAFALQRNHNITFVTHGNPIIGENITSFIFEDVYERMYKECPITEPSVFNAMEECDQLYYVMHKQSIFDSETKGLQILIDHINSGIKYDLIIWDSTSGYFLLFYLLEKLNYPPVIATAAYGICPSLSKYFGQDYNAAYIPLWSTAFTDEMTFFQRVYNLALTFYCLHGKENFKFDEMELAKKIFRMNSTTYDEFEKHITLLLMNNDPIMDYPFPIPPTIIPVAGLHIKRPGNISKELKEILDNAKEGVILFSLGTNVRSKNIGLNRRNILIKGLSRLKQTVLWKYEEEIENLPKNIIIKKWIPQNEVLGHPNIKLFISHCGNLGTQEAMYHGVPVVGIPFFADQFVILNKLVRRKLGKELNYKHLTEDILYDTITEVLNNPIYRENMQKLSKRYKDQPQEALDKAVFWVEYVLRHGAEHLHIAAKNISFIKLYFLDLWMLIILALISIIYILTKIYKLLFKKEVNSKSKKKKQ